MEKELISVIVPCYNEQEVLPLFRDEIIRVTNEMKSKYPHLEFEFMFINDGSRDDTLKLLREYSLEDKRFRYVSFSRNFGKESAMFAGLENCKGDYAVILDADLQHPPKLIPQMYEYVKSGEYDCAGTRRISREGEPKLLSFFSSSFYKVINKISQTQIVDGAQDFRLMTRQMVDAILSMREYNRFTKGIFSWVGFRTKYIEVENTERAAGKTTWNFWKLLKYSFEGIFAFSTFPLSFSIIFAALAFIAAVILLIAAIVNSSEMLGIMCLVCFMGGIRLFCLEVLGQYIAKTYLEVKKRPVYIIGETEEIYRKRKEN